MQQYSKQGKGFPFILFLFTDWWQGEVEKKKENRRKTKACPLETHKILGSVFEDYSVIWFDYSWFFYFFDFNIYMQFYILLEPKNDLGKVATLSAFIADF